MGYIYKYYTILNDFFIKILEFIPKWMIKIYGNIMISRLQYGY